MDSTYRLLAEAKGSDRLSPSLLALWFDRNGEWEQAHRVVQDDGSADAAWVHAYLHRKEGDLSNAAYWYGRAGRPVCRETLDEEWDNITRMLLEG